jgi:hypothetical protein
MEMHAYGAEQNLPQEDIQMKQDYTAKHLLITAADNTT